jgi:hypothetical protein
MAGEKEKGGEEERKCGEKVEGNDPRTRSGHFTARLKTPWGSTILSLSCEFTQCQTPACRRALGRHPGHHAAKGGASWDPANEIQRHPESTSAQRTKLAIESRDYIEIADRRHETAHPSSVQGRPSPAPAQQRHQLAPFALFACIAVDTCSTLSALDFARDLLFLGLASGGGDGCCFCCCGSSGGGLGGGGLGGEVGGGVEYATEIEDGGD